MLTHAARERGGDGHNHTHLVLWRSLLKSTVYVASPGFLYSEPPTPRRRRRTTVHTCAGHMHASHGLAKVQKGGEVERVTTDAVWRLKGVEGEDEAIAEHALLLRAVGGFVVLLDAALPRLLGVLPRQPVLALGLKEALLWARARRARVRLSAVHSLGTLPRALHSTPALRSTRLGGAG